MPFGYYLGGSLPINFYTRRFTDTRCSHINSNNKCHTNSNTNTKCYTNSCGDPSWC